MPIIEGRAHGYPRTELKTVHGGSKLDNDSGHFVAHCDWQLLASPWVFLAGLGWEDGPSEILVDVGATDTTIGNLDTNFIWTASPVNVRDGITEESRIGQNLIPRRDLLKPQVFLSIVA